MSIQSPAGTLDIKNATLRVGKLEVSNIQGVDTALNVTRANSVLIYDDQVSTTTFNGFTSSVGVRDTGNGYLDLAGGYVYWGQKLPNSWVMDFEMDIRSGTNAGPLYANVFSTTNTGGDGYSFTFNDSNDKISLYYDSTLLTETTVSGLFTASEDWQKVVINYERGLIAISLDGSRKFYYKDIERETPYVNGEYVSFSSASTDGRKIRDLRIVNGEKWVYSGESNVVYTQGSVGIGVTDPTVALDVSGTVKATAFDGDGSAITNISSANVGDFASNVVRIENLETSNGHIWSNLASNVTTLRDEIDSNLATARTDLQSNVTILRDEIDSNLATARTDLQSNVTILRGEIDSNLATARTDLQSNVTILRDEIDSNLATARTDLQSNVTILRGEIDSNLATARTDLQSNVTILRGEIDSNLATARTDLQSNVTILRGEIDSNLATARTDLQSNVTILRDTAITFMGTKTFQDDVVLESNLRVQGDLLVANTVNMTVSDPILELGSNNQNTGDVGLVMTRHGASNSNVAIFFDETADTLKLGYTLNGAGDSTLEFDSNALAVSVQGALTASTGTFSGDVGIGTTAPGYTLDVDGDINFTGTFYQGGSPFVSSLWTDGQDSLYYRSNVEVGTANLFVDTTTSRVGINTITPGYDLDVDGDINFTGNFYQGGSPFVSSEWTTGSESLYYRSNVEIGTANLFVDTTTSRVGINTITPGYDLDVHGTSNVGALTVASVSGNGSGLTSLNATNISSGTINKDRLPGTLNNTTIGSLAIGANDVTLTAKANYHGLKILKAFDSPDEPATLLLSGDGDVFDDIAFEIRGNTIGSSVDTTTTRNSDDTTFGILHTGHTYIGYANLNPGEVGGNSQSGDPMLNVNGAGAFTGDFEVGTANLFVDVSTSNVGIGTTSPGYKLHVNGTSQFEAEMRWDLGTHVSHAGNGTNKDWYIRSGETAGKVILQDGGGNVGIGTNSPAYKLDVHGTSNVGALTATSVSGNGSGLTSLNASNISSGTINKDRLPGTLNDTTFGSITLTSSTCLYVDGDYLAYNPVEGGSSISRNFVKFIKTDNASYPFYTNRTPSGDVVIGSGTTAAGGEIERMRFKGGDGTRDIEVSNANLVVSGNITGGTIDAAKISNGTLADSTGGVKAIYFTNTEQSGYYTDKSGILAFDQNFYDDTEYGTGTYDPDATFVGGNGGGLLIKNEDGWGAIFTSQNTRWAKGYWDTLNVTNTVTASTFSGSGSGLTSLNASNLTSGTVSSDRLSLAASDIPDLSASKITTGTLTRPIDTTTGTFSGRVDSDRYLTSNTFPLPDPNQHSFRHVCMITNSSVPYGLTQAGGCIYEYNPSTGDTVRVVEPVSEPTAGTFNATGGREYFPMGSPMTIVNTQKMVPFTNLGSLFGFIESRYDASTAYLYAPYSNVTVEYFHDTSVTGTPTSTIVVPSKTVTTFTCTTAGGTNSHIFVAKGGKILMSSTGNGGDTRVLAPLSTIAYGYNNTNFANDIYRENNVTTSGKCVYSNQNVPLILSQAGDGDGGDGTCGIPFELVADTYIVPHDIRGWMIQFLYTETVVNVAYWSATNSQWEQYGTYSPSGTPSILSPEQLQVGKMSLTGTDIGTSHTLWMFTGTKDFTLTVEEYTDLERTVSGFRAHQVAQQIQTNLLDNVVQDSNGNVGIGTENPGQALHIYRSGANNAVIKAEAAGTQEAEIQLYHTGDAAAWSMYMPANSDSLRFYRNGDKMTLTSGGNVGIGTVSPVAKLQVAGQTVISENITTQNGTTVYNADLSVVSEIGYTASGTADIDIGATSSTIGGYTSVYRYKLYTDVASGNSKFKIASVAGPSGTYNGYGTVTDRITLDNNGNVGIGTTSPGAKLHLVVPDIGNTTEVLRLQNGNGTGDIVSTSGGFIGMHLRDNNVGGGEVARISWKHDGGDGTAEGLGQLGFWTSNTGSAEGVPEERMTILADGNVGIGTASPQDTLHVYGAPFIQHDTRRSLGTAAWYKIGTWDAAGSDGARLKISLLGAVSYNSAGRARGGETIIYASINNDNNASSANIDGLVESHGKLVTNQVKFKQVGTDRTKYEIHARILTFTQHSMSVECSGTTTFTKEWVASSDPGAESATVSHAIFSTVVDNSGNVGIGTTSPGYALTIRKNTNTLLLESENAGVQSNVNIDFKNYDAQDPPGARITARDDGVYGSHLFFSTRTGNGSSLSEKLRIASNGNVGVGTTTPHAKLHVNGGAGGISSALRVYFKYNDYNSSYISLQLNNGGWGPMSIYASDDIVTAAYIVSHSGTIGASDTRIKKNIVDANDAECLETLRLLKPKKYQYKDEVDRGTEPVWGFIAQEVRETLPYATELRRDVLPNIYELANVSQSNVITFTNFNTSNLESNATTLIRTKGIDGEDHDIHLAEVIDDHTIRVEEDLSEWTGSVDETGNVITEITTTTITPEEYNALEDTSGYIANITGYQNANVVISVEEYNALEDTAGYEEIIDNYTKTTTTYPGTQLFVYGQEVDDFIFLKKDAIWTVATAALQEVDRQLQAEKARNDALEARIAALENA
jgi:hypothetical protein